MLNDPLHNRRTCPYCGSPAGFSFRYDEAAYYHCLTCDLVFRDEPENLRAERMRDYEYCYFEDRSDDQRLGERDRLYALILNDIERERPPGSILDAGCGCGIFLRLARDRGWRIRGVDPSEGSIAYARTLVQDAAARGTIGDLKDGRTYDVITMINVLDHTEKPWQETLAARELLKPGGLLYLRFPNGRYHQTLWKGFSRFMNANLLRRYVIFHQHSFRRRFIEGLLARQGYVNAATRNSYISDQLNPILFLGQRSNEIFRKGFNAAMKAARRLPGPTLPWGPSLTVTADLKG
jgi:2-polyprenyl-3-methyl-5-hydroxy-6-metoxy-1,4-benzoquinol methylase